MKSKQSRLKTRKSDMKNIFVAAALVICIFLTACAGKAKPMVLPPAEEIDSIDITKEDTTINNSDGEWISRLVAEMSDAEPTNRESVQDYPQNVDYIAIHINYGDNISTLFFYEQDETYYIEQPYQGIYESGQNMYELLGGNS